MSDLRGSQLRPPVPGPADLASFSAFASWFVRINGIAMPESELRQSWNSTPDGAVGKQRFPPGAAGIARDGLHLVPRVGVFDDGDRGHRGLESVLIPDRSRERAAGRVQNEVDVRSVGPARDAHERAVFQRRRACGHNEVEELRDEPRR